LNSEFAGLSYRSSDVPSFNWALQIGMASDAGVRPDNQDRIAHFPSHLGHVCVLADGMGGYEGGAVAASIAISRLPEFIAAEPSQAPPEQAIVESIGRLNQAIIDKGKENANGLQGMGSTLAVLLVRETSDGPMAIGAHIGDSRIYFLRGERLFRLTRDHTVVERLVETGVLSPEDVQRHPQAGVLTRALGCSDAVDVDLTPWRLLQPDDVFVLCSDGLSAYAEEDAIRGVLLQHHEPHAAASHLVALAFVAQSKDNISALVCRVAMNPLPPN
jgi:serine/threonine protein phosphatase PrpC